MAASSNRNAWSFFIASALLALLAALLNSFVITVVANVLFACAIVYVTIHFAQQRRLAYFSVAVGLLGILFLFGSHWFAGAALIGWGVLAAVVDCIQMRRWRVLVLAGAFVALCGIGALMIVGGIFSEYRNLKAKRVAAASAVTAPAVAPSQPEPAPVATETTAPEPEPEMVVITTDTAEEARKEAERVREANRKQEEQHRALVKGVLDVQHRLDMAGRTYHQKDCHEVTRYMQPINVVAARAQNYVAHSCVPQY
jgi:hypothetical protein